MLKSSNLNSVIHDLAESTSDPAPNSTQTLSQIESDDDDCPNQDKVTDCSLQLSAGLLQIAEPPLDRVRGQLKELIGKQNKIYIDLSKEKYKLDCSEVAKLNDMMNDVKRYKEKLTRIKKEMQNIYQRTKDLKKRAANVATCKQRDYQRKLEKQQHEESLIGSQTQ